MKGGEKIKMSKTKVEPKPAELPKEEEDLAKLETKANADAKAEAEAGEEGESEEAPEKVEGESETPTPESAPEETKTVKSESETKPESQEEGKEEEPEEDNPATLKAKGQKRVEKLVEERNKGRDEISKLKGLLKEKYPSEVPGKPEVTGEEPEGTGLPWESPDGEDQEITQEQFDKKVDENATKLVDKRLRLQEMMHQVREDVNIVESQYSELSPGKRDQITGKVVEANPDYNEKLVETIKEMWKGLVKTQPTLRLSVFVKRIMTLREEGAEKGKGEVTAKVNTQAANQAITPTGSPAGQTDKDLETKIKSATSEEELAEIEKSLPHA